MSKNSREATESAAGAILRMARLNCYFYKPFMTLFFVVHIDNIINGS